MLMPLITREAWLTHIAEKYLWPRIQAAGGKSPDRYRVSVGFPRGCRGGKGHAIGQCWSTASSADHTFEIFVSPELLAFDAVAVLSHELVHAAVGPEQGHGKPFKHIALGIGLTGKMRSTLAGEELTQAIAKWLQAEPPYPHAPLSTQLRKRPGSRLIKAHCDRCGYVVYVTRVWLDISPPICPDPTCGLWHESMVIGK